MAVNLLVRKKKCLDCSFRDRQLDAVRVRNVKTLGLRRRGSHFLRTDRRTVRLIRTEVYFEILKTLRQDDQVSGGPDVRADRRLEPGFAKTTDRGRRQVYDDVYFRLDRGQVRLAHAQARLRAIAADRLHLTPVTGIFHFHPVEKLNIRNNMTHVRGG